MCGTPTSSYLAAIQVAAKPTSCTMPRVTITFWKNLSTMLNVSSSVSSLISHDSWACMCAGNTCSQSAWFTNLISRQIQEPVRQWQKQKDWKSRKQFASGSCRYNRVYTTPVLHREQRTSTIQSNRMWRMSLFRWGWRSRYSSDWRGEESWIHACGRSTSRFAKKVRDVPNMCLTRSNPHMNSIECTWTTMRSTIVTKPAIPMYVQVLFINSGK